MCLSPECVLSFFFLSLDVDVVVVDIFLIQFQMYVQSRRLSLVVISSGVSFVFFFTSFFLLSLVWKDEEGGEGGGKEGEVEKRKDV